MPFLALTLAKSKLKAVNPQVRETKCCFIKKSLKNKDFLIKYRKLYFIFRNNIPNKSSSRLKRDSARNGWRLSVCVIRRIT